MWPESESDGQSGRSFIEEARRRQIVAAAVEVIAEVGYTNASLARIAAHAGISKGVISYHFAGKDDLMYQLVVQLYEEGATFMLPLIKAAVGARERLTVYIQANLRFIADNRRHVSAMADVVWNLRDKEGRAQFGPEKGEDEVREPLVNLLASGQKEGVFGDFDPEVMSMMIRDAIDGVGGRLVARPDLDIGAYTEQMCRVFDVVTRPDIPEAAS